MPPSDGKTGESATPAELTRSVGWAEAMGLEMIRATPEEVVLEWTVDSRHLQPFGLVHGGVHSGVVETACSLGATLNAAPRGQVAVGVENHTSFLRAVSAKGARLRATARPLQIGKRAQLWQTDIVDEEGRLVATGRVRLFTQEPR